LVDADAQRIIGRRIRGPEARNVETRNLDDIIEARGNSWVDNVCVVWEDDNAWLLRSGKIGWDVSREVNAQELSMIKLFRCDGNSLGGSLFAATTPP
jgi:hypothetical protein